MHFPLRAAILVIMLALAAALTPIYGQEPEAEPPDASVGSDISSAQPEPQFRPQARPREKTPQDIEFERKQARALNKERHKELKNETDKLLELAQQLKEHVEKTNENVLSLDVIKKAEEIEKLAKRVKEKMKGYWGPSVTR